MKVREQRLKFIAILWIFSVTAVFLWYWPFLLQTSENFRDITNIHHFYRMPHVNRSGESFVVTGIDRVSKVYRAIKVIPRNGNTSRSKTDIEQEIKVMKTLKSYPGACQLQEALATPEYFFLVMERMHHNWLDFRSLKPGKMDESLEKVLMYQVLKILKHLHDQNIVHGAVTPHNILLNSDIFRPQVKLCDFKLSRNRGETLHLKYPASHKYQAPEIGIEGVYTDFPQDIWSAGIILHESLSGVYPYGGGEEFLHLLKNQEVSSDAVDLTRKLLHVDPASRYTAEQALNHSWFQEFYLWQDLQHIEAGVGQRYLTREEEDKYWTNLSLPDFYASDEDD